VHTGLSNGLIDWGNSNCRLSQYRTECLGAEVGDRASHSERTQHDLNLFRVTDCSDVSCDSIRSFEANSEVISSNRPRSLLL
jgi:hypothetical protein